MTIKTRETIGTLEATEIPRGQLEALAQFASSLDESELRDLLLSLTSRVLDGADLAVVEETTEYTPAEVAARLGMSRTHLYKLLDNGEIPSYRVGRDRRISFKDVVAFEAQRQRDRRELAERFANPTSTDRGAIEELLNDL
ncbi:MAG TPA: helix-turn-helix domain-containing protein [Kribbella sp.]|uniref:helix-turn-helix domain-containing protein n=1 Tax=Kribbella sp. TaxID=1871183 RepID=UPI002D788FE9|nr:helix-turn-helix domain-containing protein [Kribbella sp.]HET6296296.1 helix-turn-helix domain-containing protein [Kribbella sp.]